MEATEGLTDPKETEVLRTLAQFGNAFPRPILRVSEDDRFDFVNEAGQPVLEAMGASLGQTIPEPYRSTFVTARRTQELLEDVPDAGLLAVTSADRLNAGWHAAQRARKRGLAAATSHIDRLLADLPSHCRIVTVIDGHPATLAWLGGVHGHATVGLGVEHFGQTGTVDDLYRHYGIDAQSIAAAASSLSPGRPVRHLRSVG